MGRVLCPSTQSTTSPDLLISVARAGRNKKRNKLQQRGQGKTSCRIHTNCVEVISMPVGGMETR